jgi:hypothetical protein
MFKSHIQENMNIDLKRGQNPQEKNFWMYFYDTQCTHILRTFITYFFHLKIFIEYCMN